METIVEFLGSIVGGFEVILFAYFFLSCLYVLVFAVAGHAYKTRKENGKAKLHKIAVFIPAYKEDNVIKDVAIDALRQQYPPSFYDVIVIADSLQQKTLEKLHQLPIKVVEVDFEQSTKAKALNAAMDEMTKSYDFALVLDADNMMEKDFLTKLNSAFNKGHKVVQGHRKAKNLNTSYAMLDAASEEINNHIFRKGHSALGFSSGLIGSGMAFQYDLFKEIMSTIKAVGGFDKELEFELASRKIHIEYLQDAIVLDEKIQKAADFSTQRRRWIATQFVYLRKYFNQGIKELVKNGNINFFDKVVQMMLPPRVLLLGFTMVFTVTYLVKDLALGFSSNVAASLWVLNAFMLTAAFALSFPRSLYSLSALKSIMSLPSAFIRMALLLFRLKGANKKFIHTTHGVANS